LKAVRLLPWAFAIACVPETMADEGIVRAPRILAVQADAAEAAPGQTVKLSALVAHRDRVAPDSLGWAICNARRPLDELGPVADACLSTTDSLVPLGVGFETMATVPADACRRFGPEVGLIDGQQVASRPTDPDATGGYFLPIRIDGRTDGLGGSGIFRLRLTCDPQGATAESLTRYRRDSRPNRAPKEPWLQIDGRPLGGEGASAKPGARMDWRVGWPACAGVTANAPCDGREGYVDIDRSSGQVVVRRESMTVHFFATGGRFDESRLGVLEDDNRDEVGTHWTAPEQAGTVTGWVVLRDGRGGVVWKELRIAVE
jgi:hypothetical protein